MRSSWCGFLPQHDIIKLQWAMLEGCETDVATKAPSALLGGAEPGSGEDSEEGSWSSAELGLGDIKAKA